MSLVRNSLTIGDLVRDGLAYSQCGRYDFVANVLKGWPNFRQVKNFIQPRGRSAGFQRAMALFYPTLHRQVVSERIAGTQANFYFLIRSKF
jgi:hypothetical protein